jgi:tetratricopeptide (TPR) repeat protein
MFKGLFGSRSQRHYARGIEQFNEGHLIEAIAFFEEAIASDDDGPGTALARFYRAEAHTLLGGDALEGGDHSGALGYFDAALTEHTRFPDLHIQRAIALLHLDDPLAAERAARSALELNPDFIDAGAVQVVALIAQGDSVRAEDAASRWTKRAAERGDALAAAFTNPAGLFAALVARRVRRAERRRIVERAEAALRDGFWADAAAGLEPLVDETPLYPDLRLRLAAAYLGQGELDRARTQLDAALERNTEFADAHVLAGIVALRCEQVRTAREHFALADASGRVPMSAVYGAMLCDLRMGEFEAALQRMNRLAAEDVPPEAARVLHAILESLAGRAATAAERFDAALATTRRVELLVDIAAWAVECHDGDMAGRALDAVDVEDRTRVDVVRATVRLRRMEGAFERARQMCESALMDHPHDAGLLLDLASLLGGAGEPQDALRCLELINDPGPEAIVLRARLLRQVGHLDEARALLEDPPASGATALELLYLCRATDDFGQAGRIWATRPGARALELAWRVQDPERWLGPLRPWPATAASSRAEA